jgi:hypothetical protein
MPPTLRSPPARAWAHTKGHLGIPVSIQPKVTFGSPSVLVKGIPMGFVQRSYDVAEGWRFVGVTVATGYTPSTAASIREIDVVLNWQEELKQRVPMR